MRAEGRKRAILHGPLLKIGVSRWERGIPILRETHTHPGQAADVPLSSLGVVCEQKDIWVKDFKKYFQKWEPLPSTLLRGLTLVLPILSTLNQQSPPLPMMAPPPLELIAEWLRPLIFYSPWAQALPLLYFPRLTLQIMGHFYCRK